MKPFAIEEAIRTHKGFAKFLGSLFKRCRNLFNIPHLGESSALVKPQASSCPIRLVQRTGEFKGLKGHGLKMNENANGKRANENANEERPAKRPSVQKKMPSAEGIDSSDMRLEEIRNIDGVWDTRVRKLVRNILELHRKLRHYWDVCYVHHGSDCECKHDLPEHFHGTSRDEFYLPEYVKDELWKENEDAAKFAALEPAEFVKWCLNASENLKTKVTSLMSDAEGEALLRYASTELHTLTREEQSEVLDTLVRLVLDGRRVCERLRMEKFVKCSSGEVQTYLKDAVNAFRRRPLI